jgi:hypothetical protein
MPVMVTVAAREGDDRNEIKIRDAKVATANCASPSPPINILKG